MSAWVGVAVVAVLAGATSVGYLGYRRSLSEAERAYGGVLGPPVSARRSFDPAELAGLPEVAQRYFRHAIAPGTPLYSAAEIEMHGSFLLGDKRKFQTYAMSAREVLRPPDQFVWLAQLHSGPLRIGGSDALAGGKAWTRFWMLGLLPVADERSSPDMVRSAEFRAAIEGALWLPVSLLPENGVEWTQAGTDQAMVVMRRLGPRPIALTLTLDSSGAVRSVVGQRWSNANPDKRFRLQPFGGTMLREVTYQGLTIPAVVEVGNQFGTDDYLPFFQATVTAARYR